MKNLCIQVKIYYIHKKEIMLLRYIYTHTHTHTQRYIYIDTHTHIHTYTFFFSLQFGIFVSKVRLVLETELLYLRKVNLILERHSSGHLLFLYVQLPCLELPLFHSMRLWWKC